MQISVSSTLTVYHDGQFWIGTVEYVEDGKLGAARIVFGVELSDERQILTSPLGIAGKPKVGAQGMMLPSKARSEQRTLRMSPAKKKQKRKVIEDYA